jgi:hypothetical protein
MKSKLIYTTLFALTLAIAGCDENEVMPSYEKVGTSTSTIVNIILPPDDDPVTPLELFPVTVTYVNPSVDPLQSVELFMQIGADDFVSVESWNVTSEPKDQLISHTVELEAPETIGTKVTFDVVLTSGKDYEQRKRASLDVKAP